MQLSRIQMRHHVCFLKMDKFSFTVSNAHKMEDGGLDSGGPGYVTMSYNCFGFETENWGAGHIVLKWVFPFTSAGIRHRWELKPLKDTEALLTNE
jgi:hypothetical protein